MPYRLWAPPVFRNALQRPLSPQDCGESFTFFDILARVWSHPGCASYSGSAATPVSDVPHTDSPCRFSGALMLSLPQCLRHFPSSEALSRLVFAFQDSEAMSLRRFQSVICRTKSDALSRCRHTTGSASRRPLRLRRQSPSIDVRQT